MKKEGADEPQHSPSAPTNSASMRIAASLPSASFFHNSLATLTSEHDAGFDGRGAVAFVGGSSPSAPSSLYHYIQQREAHKSSAVLDHTPAMSRASFDDAVDPNPLRFTDLLSFTAHGSSAMRRVEDASTLSRSGQLQPIALSLLSLQLQGSAAAPRPSSVKSDDEEEDDERPPLYQQHRQQHRQQHHHLHEDDDDVMQDEEGDTASTPMRSLGRDSLASPLIMSFPALIGPRLPWVFSPTAIIGRGASSSVWKMVNNETGKFVAGKLSILSAISQSSRRLIDSEAKNMVVCGSHPCVVQLIGQYRHGERTLLVLEYLSGGDLGEQVERRARMKRKLQEAKSGNNSSNSNSSSSSAALATASFDFRDSEVLVIFAQIVLAVHYLHQRQVVHRDLKLKNVFFTDAGLLKLGDFGFSKHCTDGVQHKAFGALCGTPFYQAPEIWRRTAYDGKSDVWSLGVMLYELLALERPFQSPNSFALHALVVSGIYRPLPDDRCPPLRKLVVKLLKTNPEERPSMDEIMASSVMQHIALPLLHRQVSRLPSTLECEKRELQKAIKAVWKG